MTGHESFAVDQGRIIEMCNDPPRNRVYNNGRVEIIRTGTWAIKFGTISAEKILNQLHAQNSLDPSVIRIPCIHAHFEANGLKHIIMDYVYGEGEEIIQDSACCGPPMI